MLEGVFGSDRDFMIEILMPADGFALYRHGASGKDFRKYAGGCHRGDLTTPHTTKIL